MIPDPFPRGDWNLPYEETPGMIADASDAQLAGEITITSALLPCDRTIDEAGVTPGILLRFGTDALTGRPIPPILLVVGADLLQEVPKLVADAVAGTMRRYKAGLS